MTVTPHNGSGEAAGGNAFAARTSLTATGPGNTAPGPVAHFMGDAADGNAAGRGSGRATPDTAGSTSPAYAAGASSPLLAPAAPVPEPGCAGPSHQPGSGALGS